MGVEGIGARVARKEDKRFITGKGRYTDDIALPRTVHAFVLRSPAAHANLKRIDAVAARRMPGVLLVLTGEDCKADATLAGATRDGPCRRLVAASEPTRRSHCRGPGAAGPGLVGVLTEV